MCKKHIRTYSTWPTSYLVLKPLLECHLNVSLCPSTNVFTLARFLGIPSINQDTPGDATFVSCSVGVFLSLN